MKKFLQKEEMKDERTDKTTWRAKMKRVIKKILSPLANFSRKIWHNLNKRSVDEILKKVSLSLNENFEAEKQKIGDERQSIKNEIQSLRESVSNVNEKIALTVEQFREKIKENDILPPVFAKYKEKTIVVHPCDPRYCTTCLACMNVCPVGAIEKTEDSEGFYIIKVNAEKCVGCKKCVEVCHVNKPKSIVQRVPKILYAAKSNDDELRLKSSSGGLFALFANHVLSQRGVVFGAAFDEDFKVHHIAVENLDELEKLRGSKYVQSDVGRTFSDVKTALESGKKVLYSGTPCQIAGLRNFIGLQKNLYTIDVVCHGVPSPKFFEDYKQSLEKLYGKIISYDFRCKTAEVPNSFQLGWKEYGTRVEFDSGTVLYETRLDNIFMKGFLQELTNRPVCHRCPYAVGKRAGDITLGDFWGYQELNGDMKDDDKGISALLINSEKGMKLFSEIKDRIIFFERDLKILQDCNRPLKAPSLLNPDRENFWNAYNEFGFDYACERYFK